MKPQTGLIIGLTLAAPAILFVNSVVRADGGDGSLIHACINKRDGTTRIVQPNTTCKTSEYPLHWNSQHTIVAPLGSNSVDLSQMPGEDKYIVFEDDGNGKVSQLLYLQPEWDPALRQYIFAVATDEQTNFPPGYLHSQWIFGIQDGLLDMSYSTMPYRNLMFAWEGGEEGGPAQIQYGTQEDRFSFQLPTTSGDSHLLSIEEGLLDASGSDIRGKIYRQANRPGEVDPEAFAFWVDTDDGNVYLVLNVEGTVYATQMLPSP